MYEHKKIVFISTALTAPYVLKRIKAFRNEGFDTVLYAYNRGDDFERSDKQDLGTVIDLGFIESGRRYMSKLYKHIWSLRRAFNENNGDSIYIVFQFDLALINLIFFRRKIVYHISDITYTKIRCNIIVKLFRIIERKIINNSILTIVTSLGFKQFLYRSNENAEKIIEIPNLLQEDNPYKRVRYIPEKSVSHLSFGFVGLNRYRSPINIARIIGERFPQHDFYFYGNGIQSLMDDIQNLSSKYSNIHSKGKFNSSSDLDEIYTTIDILVCCYDTENINVRLAEPNKLYEAIFFNKPIVVSANTYLAEKIKHLNIGYSLDAMNDDSVIDFVNTLTVEDVNRKKINMNKVLTKDLIDNEENLIKRYFKS